MLKVGWNILKYVIGAILSIFRPLRRLFCQRRKSSDTDGAELTSIGTGSLKLDASLVYSLDGNEAQVELESWDTWDVQSQPNYRPQSGSYPDPQSSHPNTYGNRSETQMNGLSLKTPQGYSYNRKETQQAENEPDINYFEDMVPKVKKQQKILIRKKDTSLSSSTQPMMNRLAVMSDIPFTNSELEAWQDEVNAWETEEASEDLTWQAEEALRENKRKERMERHMEQQKKKQRKDEMRGPKGGSLVATKLS